MFRKTAALLLALLLAAAVPSHAAARPAGAPRRALRDLAPPVVVPVLDNPSSLSSSSGFSNINPDGGSLAVAGASTIVRGSGTADSLATSSNADSETASEAHGKGTAPGDTASGSATSQVFAGPDSTTSNTGVMVDAKGTGQSSADTFGVTEVQGTGGNVMKAVTGASGTAVGDPEGTGIGGSASVLMTNDLGTQTGGAPTTSGFVEAGVDKSAAAIDAMAAGSLAGPKGSTLVFGNAGAGSLAPTPTVTSGHAVVEGSAAVPADTSTQATIDGDARGFVLACADPDPTKCGLVINRPEAPQAPSNP